MVAEDRRYDCQAGLALRSAVASSAECAYVRHKAAGFQMFEASQDQGIVV